MASPKVLRVARSGNALRAQAGRNGGLTRLFSKRGQGGKPNPMRKAQIGRIRSVYKQMNFRAGKPAQAAAGGSKG